jgi:hypothetical protein
LRSRLVTQRYLPGSETRDFPGRDRGRIAGPYEHGQDTNQEVTVNTDVDALAQLLLETAMHHDSFEKSTAPHNWWDWYAPYLAARQEGSSPEQATAAADRYMAETRQIVRQTTTA